MVREAVPCVCARVHARACVCVYVCAHAEDIWKVFVPPLFCYEPKNILKIFY